jgi:hypothetical protein
LTVPKALENCQVSLPDLVVVLVVIVVVVAAAEAVVLLLLQCPARKPDDL